MVRAKTAIYCDEAICARFREEIKILFLTSVKVFQQKSSLKFLQLEQC